MAGQHDSNGLRPAFPDLPEQFTTIHSGHHEIGHDQLSRLFLHDAQGFLATAGEQKFVILTLEDSAQRGQDVGLVIHQQESVRGLFGLRGIVVEVFRFLAVKKRCVAFCHLEFLGTVHGQTQCHSRAGTGPAVDFQVALVGPKGIASHC